VAVIDWSPIEHIPELAAEQAAPVKHSLSPLQVAHHCRPEFFQGRAVAGVEVIIPHPDTPQKAPGRQKHIPTGGHLPASQRIALQRLGRQTQAAQDDICRPKGIQGEQGFITSVAHPVGLLVEWAVGKGVFHAQLESVR